MRGTHTSASSAIAESWAVIDGTVIGGVGLLNNISSVSEWILENKQFEKGKITKTYCFTFRCVQTEMHCVS